MAELTPSTEITPVIVIPARLKASRLPDKPLADVGGVPLIVQVYRRACEAAVGPVLVATDSTAVAEAVTAHGGEAVATRSDHASGSDRIHEAVEAWDPAESYNVVVNVQGDLPTVAPATVAATLRPLAACGETAIATPVAPLGAGEAADPNVVKAAAELPPGAAYGRALYFSRAPVPYGEPGPAWHHIGLYAYRRAALQQFVALPPSHLEIQERLEQLRALAHGLRLDVVPVTEPPLGVDTPDDLARARALLDSADGGDRN